MRLSPFWIQRFPTGVPVGVSGIPQRFARGLPVDVLSGSADVSVGVQLATDAWCTFVPVGVLGINISG